MLTYEITYEDLDGKTVTDTLYFHLSQREIIEWNVRDKGGLEATLKRIIDAEDLKSLIEEFKYVLLMSYGLKSEDGKSFIKNDELRDKFSQTLAYNELFMKLATDENFAAWFIKGMVPKDFQKIIEEEEAKNALLPSSPNEPSKEKNGLPEQQQEK